MSQYIGKTISLISVTDNRYVGLLENIDSEKGTITLGNVRCFGTEGRKNWGPEEIFPNPTIYQSVQFNGNDVKDLNILEVRLEDVHPVLPPTTNQLPIVSPPSATVQQQQQQQMTNMNRNQQNQSSGNSMEQASVNKDIPAAVAGYGVYAPTQTIETGFTTTATEGLGNNNDNKVLDDEPKNKEIGITTNTTNVVSETPNVSNEPVYNTQQQRFNYSNPHPHRTRNQKIEIPNSDFDFASNNARFLKENTSMTSEKKESSTDSNESGLNSDSSKEGTFYNKESSFFDNISTSTEINTNMRWQEEKELNLDTFGQVSIRPRFHSNRGRGRGNYRGRGRGNYRGRGRGNGNNNYYRGGYHNSNYRDNRNNNNNNNGGFHYNFNQVNETSSFQNQPTVEF